MRGSCAPCPIKALAHSPRAPWEEAPAGSSKFRKYGNEESYGKVQGSAGEERHDIGGTPGSLARNTMEIPLWKGDLKQEPGVA